MQNKYSNNSVLAAMLTEAYGEIAALESRVDSKESGLVLENEALKHQVQQLEEELEKEREKRSCTMGVGTGSGNKFIYGDYESVKIVQDLFIKVAELEKKHELYQFNYAVDWGFVNEQPCATFIATDTSGKAMVLACERAPASFPTPVGLIDAINEAVSILNSNHCQGIFREALVEELEGYTYILKGKDYAT